MPTLPVRRRGRPKGTVRINYARILKLLQQSNPVLSFRDIATKCGCSVGSVSKFNAMTTRQRNALASK